MSKSSLYLKTTVSTTLNYLSKTSPEVAEYFRKIADNEGYDKAACKLAKHLVIHADTSNLP